MPDLIQCYYNIYRDSPLGAQGKFGHIPEEDLYVLFRTSCRDPPFLYTFLCLARSRYCRLSTGDILMCGTKGTNSTPESPTHHWDDCAWASKGLHQLSILRPKGENCEYGGPLRSSESLLTDPEREYERQQFDLVDEFFAARKIQQIILV
jgi:hypothetical protein